MDKYLEAEKRLAELLGYEDLRDSGFEPGRFIGRINDDKEKLPAWCRDNGAAFALMVEHGVSVTTESTESGIESWFPGTFIDFTTWAEHHPDRETAARYAVVLAVIAKLEAK